MTSTINTTNTATAAQTYIDRKNRTEQPEGAFDKKGRWYPEQILDCCSSVRQPSAAYPYSYMLHCRTITHIANEFGIDAQTLRKEIRSIEKPKREGGTDYYKSVAVTEENKYVSIFDGETQYQIGKTVAERPARNHGGGIYVYKSQQEAEEVEVPADSKAKDLPRIILKVRAEGSYCRYKNKLSFSKVTPLEIVQAPFQAYSPIKAINNLIKKYCEIRLEGEKKWKELSEKLSCTVKPWVMSAYEEDSSSAWYAVQGECEQEEQYNSIAFAGDDYCYYQSCGDIVSIWVRAEAIR